MARIEVTAHPSLALIKYWGKKDDKNNIPATSSLAVSLGSLSTRTVVKTKKSGDSVVIDNHADESSRFAPVFEEIRKKAGEFIGFNIVSTNDFPASAGLASSSSGIAAMTIACAKAAGLDLELRELSEIARRGSTSAARAVYGGFTELIGGSKYAKQIGDSEFWPELRIAVLITQKTKKSISSRDGMYRARETSPFYNQWIENSEGIFCQAKKALLEKDVEKLGECMRKSYLSMFGTMFTADPPVFYWRGESVELIHRCQALRSAGIGIWETMDAGPQVKAVFTENDEEKIRMAFSDLAERGQLLITRPGGGPIVHGE
ncbi:MAG: diphosphomevalonate decarboxylase [Spirochaetia bacterium]